MKTLIAIITTSLMPYFANSQDISVKDMITLFGTNNSGEIKKILGKDGFKLGKIEKNEKCIVQNWHYKSDKFYKVQKFNCPDYNGMVTVDLFWKDLYQKLNAEVLKFGFKQVEEGKKDGFDFKLYKKGKMFITLASDLSDNDEYYAVSIAEFPVLTNKL